MSYMTKNKRKLENEIGENSMYVRALALENANAKCKGYLAF